MQGEIIRYWCISKPCSKLEAGELSNRAVGPYRTILYPPLSSKFLCLPRPWYLKTMYHSMTSAHGLVVGVQTKSCESATQNINMRISEAGPVTVGNLKLLDVALAFFGSHGAVPTSWSIRVSYLSVSPIPLPVVEDAVQTVFSQAKDLSVPSSNVRRSAHSS
jgi:hypothetical protein